ncbi:MAG: ATP phosphoribosyltransferase regulatory subunit, partial [Clostridia bacterium]|nr:ATP phosphoribosyltransferase regulatory subunit [Clostridia bacterium]
MKKIFTVPQGTRDILFAECDAINRAERHLCVLFEKNGFREVRTPLVEYYECFSVNDCKLDSTQMYKFTDNTGRLLVLRPDCTVPIARMAAGRLRDFPKPLRLYYSQSVMRINRRYAGIYDERHQTGIELLGAGGKRSDLEVLALAAQILEDSGEFMLEIGHSGIFERLVEALGVDETVETQIRACIEQKNNAALTDLLAGYEENQAAQWLQKLPVMFGGSEVLKAAQPLAVFEGVSEVLDYLSQVYEALCALGLEDRLLIDLGMVSSVNYYTGIVFKGYLQDMNSE